MSAKRKRQTLAEAEAAMPQKRWFRQRAHCNPLSHNDTFVTCDSRARPCGGLRPESARTAGRSTRKTANGRRCSLLVRVRAVPRVGLTREAALTAAGQSRSATIDILDVGCGFGGLTGARAGTLWLESA